MSNVVDFSKRRRQQAQGAEVIPMDVHRKRREARLLKDEIFAGLRINLAAHTLESIDEYMMIISDITEAPHITTDESFSVPKIALEATGDTTDTGYVVYDGFENGINDFGVSNQTTRLLSDMLGVEEPLYALEHAGMYVSGFIVGTLVAQEMAYPNRASGSRKIESPFDQLADDVERLMPYRFAAGVLLASDDQLQSAKFKANAPLVAQSLTVPMNDQELVWAASRLQ